MREKGKNFAKCAKNEGCDFVKGKRQQFCFKVKWLVLK
jgi:hypothetical protein